MAKTTIENLAFCNGNGKREPNQFLVTDKLGDSFRFESLDWAISFKREFDKSKHGSLREYFYGKRKK